MTPEVVVPLLAAALGAVGGWLSSYVLKRRDDRLLGRAVARRLELELEWAEETMRTALPAPGGGGSASAVRSRGGAEEQATETASVRDEQIEQAMSNSHAIDDWGEHNDWRLMTWDDVEARNRLAVRLGGKDSWASVSTCVMRLDNLLRWVAWARAGESGDRWPSVRTVASVVQQVAETREDLRRAVGSSPRKRLVSAALLSALALTAFAVAAVLEATDEDLSEGTVAQQLRDTLDGESIVNCSGRNAATARWDCTVVYAACPPDASPPASRCAPTAVRSEQHWILTADPERRCTAARLHRVWRVGDTQPKKLPTSTRARLLGRGCTPD